MVRYFNCFLLLTLIIFVNIIQLIHSLCEIKTGEKVAILEIYESLGNQTDQLTNPEELPISGNKDEISLFILSETHRYFDLIGKKLKLNQPLDRDETGLSSIYLQISCYEKKTKLKKSIPVLIKILDINDNEPKFTHKTYSVNVSELTEVGTIIFDNLLAIDLDSGHNGLVEYSTGETLNDAFNFFAIKMPHQGLVTLQKSLDYEKSKQHFLVVVASDKALDPAKRLSSTSTLIINVMDGDDLNPAFVLKGCNTLNNHCLNPEYKASITSETKKNEVLEVYPAPIQAKDLDSLNASISYSFLNGTPEFFNDYFKIDQNTGLIKQIKQVNRSKVKIFNLWVKAMQVTNPDKFAIAKLIIEVISINKSPPLIISPSTDGYIEENSPVGSMVFLAKNKKLPFKFEVTDPDNENDEITAFYTFETTSAAFKVNEEGFLISNDANLDGDPPNPDVYTFQVIARQPGISGEKGASPPVPVNVHLIDVNDNPPKLPSFSPIYIQAGEGTRKFFKVQASDLDKLDQDQITYSIHHVSNNGRNRFRIDSKSGEIETVSKLIAGEQYSITIQATDSDNKYSQSILDVLISPGPNTGGPIFLKDRYEVEISEGISIYSTVIIVHADDPENDLITYSISDGNINSDFIIDSKTGTLVVAKQLDREKVSSYNLIIKAADVDGLFSTTSVIITITDINDENPKFLKNIFYFKVEEGFNNSYVGKVMATDADIGENAVIFYSISDRKNFKIDSETGEITTNTLLDYEKKNLYEFVATAQDRSPNARLSTASVTVEVLDIQDELPYFEKSIYEVITPENFANRHLVQVKAIDPDTVPSITYIIKKGSRKLFSIDPITGDIKTLRALDYETKNFYTLIVGTVENNSSDIKANCTVNIKVQNLNDNAPIFIEKPPPIRLRDSVPLGTVLTTLKAIDADGDNLENQIHYDINGKDKASFYFIIDPNSGVLSVKDDLRKGSDSEYKINVIAKDNGNPPLMTSMIVTVYVDHIATATPEIGVGFADSRYTVEIEENIKANTLVKLLPIINKPLTKLGANCEIISGNEEKRFYITQNVRRDCEVKVNEKSLDYEKQSKYLLTIRINAIGGVTGISRLITQIIVNVLDCNDNKPQFLIPSRYSQITKNRYLAAISSDAPADSQLIQLKAQDKDSLSNGVVTFDLLPQSDPQGRFKIDPSTGILRSSRPLEDIDSSQLPIQLSVIARDNPQLQSSSLSEICKVIVNVIENKHRLAVVLKETSTGRVQETKEEFLELIQNQTGLIAGWEKAESLKIQRKYAIESDVTGTDIWIYFIDPMTLKIITSDDPRIVDILKNDSEPTLLHSIFNKFGYHASLIRPPYSTIFSLTASVIPVPMASNMNDLGIILIILASIIAIFGFASIIYQCSLLKKMGKNNSKLKSMMQCSSLPPKIFHHTCPEIKNKKEYETQVLQMEMKLDDEFENEGNSKCFPEKLASTHKTIDNTNVSKIKLEKNKTAAKASLEQNNFEKSRKIY